MDQLGKQKVQGDTDKRYLKEQNRAERNPPEAYVHNKVPAAQHYGESYSYLFQEISKTGYISPGLVYYCTLHQKKNRRKQTIYVQIKNCDLTEITETWLDISHAWSAAMNGYRLSRNERPGQ